MTPWWMAPTLRALGGVTDLVARVHAVSARYARVGAESFADELDAELRACASFMTARDEAVMVACALWLVAEAGPRRARLADAARERAPLVAAIVGDAAAHKTAPRGLVDLGGHDRIVRHVRVWSDAWPPPELVTAQPWLADEPPIPAGWSAFEVPRYLVDAQRSALAARPSARAIANLLSDRATPDRLVVRVAARRPSTPAMIHEIIRRPHLVLKRAVRAALVENPYTPVGTALALLPSVPVRYGAVAAADVHPRVRELARALVQARDAPTVSGSRRSA